MQSITKGRAFRRTAVGALAGAVLLSVCAVAASTGPRSPRSASARTGFSRELSSLLGTNGLYASPNAVAGPDVVDLQSTAFDLLTLSAVGHPRTFPPDRLRTALLTAAADGATKAFSVTGAWDADALQRFEGVPGTVDVVSSYNPDGYFDNRPTDPTDLASRLATTATSLGLLADHRVDLPDDRKTRLAAWIEARLHEVATPAQLCDALTGLHFLGVRAALPPTAEAMWEKWIDGFERTRSLGNDGDLLDLHGSACAADLLGTHRDTGLTTASRQVVGRYLAAPETARERYYLALTAKLVGLDPSAFGRLTEDSLADLGSDGVSYGSSSHLGTITSTYWISQIGQLLGDDAWRTEFPMKEAVTAARRAPQPPVVARELSLLAKQLGLAAIPPPSTTMPTVTADTVSAWGRLQDLSAALGQPTEQFTSAPWPAADAGSRYAAWIALAHVDGDLPAAWATLVADIPDTLAREAATLSLPEILAALRVAEQRGLGPSIDREAISRRLAELKGCPRFPELYRADSGSPTCDLEATYDALRAQRLMAAGTGAR
ncbi:hypothetical protein ACFW1A_15400 [Kitasatospora sp. NPDC058965]|uniref:hypothetical protein n=1 Tax=Kitasatospora sp. NPDC058965 TaxID=3346682 RepID=UPI0036B28396